MQSHLQAHVEQQWGAQESIKVNKLTVAKRRISPKSPKNTLRQEGAYKGR